MYKRREEKLKALFLSEINNVIRNKEELRNYGLLTITDIEIIDQGKNIKVFFSVLGNEIEKKKIFLILNSLTYEIKSIFKKRLTLKIIPNISFEFDDTPQRASRVEKLFRQISLEKNDEPKKDSNY